MVQTASWLTCSPPLSVSTQSPHSDLTYLTDLEDLLTCLGTSGDLPPVARLWNSDYNMNKTKLNFDPRNLLKYCPQCQKKGTESRVKLFNPTGNGGKLVICKNSEVSIPEISSVYLRLLCFAVFLAFLSCFHRRSHDYLKVVL